MALSQTAIKWIVRVAAGTAIVVFLSLGGIFVAYSFWKSDHMEGLESGSEIVSTAMGPIEVAIVGGEGIPQLIIHGTPGGYDQSLIGWRFRPEVFEGRQIISISRPGYLRTPLSSGKTPVEQADLYAALLDEKGIDRVIVYAGSGGASSGVQFALRHPERVHGLILVVPGLRGLGLEREFEIERPSAGAMLMQDVMIWLLGERFITSYIPGLDPDHPTQMAVATALMHASLPWSLRVDGVVNDQEQFLTLNIDDWPLESLQAPTLIVHGDADENAPYEGAVAAAERLPNAKLITFADGDHFITITEAEDVNGYVNRFIGSLSATFRPGGAIF